MILLDTNIISEMMKKNPTNKVITWLDRQEVTELFITTITIAEITYGINALPKGARRRAIEEAFFKTIDGAFKHRIFSFDEASAHIYGKIMGMSGKPLSVLDRQIAAIALAQEATVATRNIRDFSDCELSLIKLFE